MLHDAAVVTAEGSHAMGRSKTLLAQAWMMSREITSPPSRDRFQKGSSVQHCIAQANSRGLGPYAKPRQKGPQIAKRG